MEKNILGNKIKMLRNGKGYSQEHLSDIAQLSLRTVQRIENGETEARGDTLNRLAKALEVGINELIETAFIPLGTDTANKSYLIIMNLAGLLIFFPFLGVIAPWILWLIKKDQYADVREQGKKIINFQLTWTLLFYFFYAWIMVCIMFHFHFPGPHFSNNYRFPPQLIMIFMIPVFNALIVIINTVLLIINKRLWYRPAFRFIR